MIVRIVKLSFKEEHISTFENLFEETKENIRNFNGCQFLELYQDKNNPTIFFTYSYWQDESYLEVYRNSDFFKKVWRKTKVLFHDKPQAWSVHKRVTLQ
ncbi:antibiotic biosynthesis monooxygenase family protein [uncultured Maribacter sp.]|uniref:putative quinol monooxygenase n=1 Tax=uncultured Maribacter sp. TaxID=431308 RepID=UPI00260AF51C|nr:antibiotic biosynthesis monooxygenase family protein [uncultured Maribacter sp.]